LTKAKEELESLCGAEKVFGILLHHCISSTLNSIVELLFGLGGKGKDLIVNLRNWGRALNNLAKGIKGAVDNDIREDTNITGLPAPELRIGDTNEGEERHYILEGIDKRSASDSPTDRGNNLAGIACNFAVTVADLVSLIENNTVPVATEEGRIVVELLIVGDIDGRAALDEAARDWCFRIIHKLPGNGGILVNFIDGAACLL
jgi:hypothetical protein